MEGKTTTVHFIPKTNSTNDEIKTVFLQKHHDSPLWVVADEQTAGRGRLGRKWESLPGNLFASFGLLIDEKHQYIHWPLVVSVSLYQAVKTSLEENPNKSFKSADLKLKWPNDLLYQNAKLAGILIETMPLQSGQHLLIIGIGVNLQTAPHIEQYQTSCLADLNWQGSRDDFFEQLKSDLEILLNSICNGQQTNDDIHKRWLSFSYPLGSKLIIDHNGEHYTGAFAGLSKVGHMKLVLKDGTVRAFAYGDVKPFGS